MRQSAIFSNFNTLKSCIAGVFLLSTSSAHAQLNIGDWENYSQLAEQGAICAGFASIMETQDVISEDIGRLWIERRKYSGALIRSAGQLETGNVPSTQDINDTISIYRDWIFSNLVQANEDPITQEADDLFVNGQEQIRQLIKTNCDDVFKQADMVILERFPELGNLTVDGQLQPKVDASQQKLDALLTANIALNRQLKDANDDISNLKKPAPPTIKTPTSRLDARQLSTAADVVTADVSAQPDAPADIIEVADTAQPAAPADAKESDDKAQPENASKTGKTKQSEPATELAAVATKDPVIAPAAKPKPVAAPVAKPKPVAAPITVAIATPAQRPTPPKPAPTPAAKRASKPDQFMAQLGAFKFKERADNMVMALNTNKPALFKDTSLVIEAYTYPSGEVFYRVLTAPVSRNEAINFCEVLWTERIGCLIKSVQ